ANADVARAQLVRTPAKVVFTSRADELQDLTGAPRLVRFADETDKDTVCEFSDLVQAAPDPEAEDMTPADLQPTDLCLVSLTSGTTGHPKAVLLSHHAVWWGCDRALRKAAFSDQDVFCSATDFIGDCSTYMMTGVPLAARARVVIPRAAACTSPLEFIEDCMACNVNCALIVPAALRAVLAAGDRVSGPFLASLKYLISASAPFGEPLAQAFRAVSQAEIIEYLGSREYGGSLSARTLGTGVISAGGGFENETLLRIVDEAGRPSAIGETGRLLVVSLGMMDGYGLPEGRAPSAYHDARAPQPGYGLWYDTNDLASYTASGGIRIEGRNSDMMKSPDGQLVMPIEIENILHGDDRVREACVFSLKDANGLEYIAGAVIPKEPQPEDALEYALRQKVLEALGHLKTPRALMITDAFPRAAQNKPDKTALKSLFASNVNMAGA
ncbi:MAG: class I adenylate-forming enzyme family protein, partial [Roseobacter sp.]